MDIVAFRERLRQYRRATGRTQAQLAAAVGLHPHALSHKLGGARRLTHDEIKAIVCTLAAWEAITTRAEAAELLGLAGLRPAGLGTDAWAQPPLSLLEPEPPARGGPPGTGRLPAPVTPLVGRLREAAEVGALLLGEARLATLTGLGGVGKTRLALAVAARLGRTGAFPGGVSFVDLAPVRDAGQLPSALAVAVGARETAGRALEGALVAALQGAPVLLVADNFEHVLPGAPLLARLLAACPGLRVLATSREALRLAGEHEYRVPPLSLPAAPGGRDAVAERSEDVGGGGGHLAAVLGSEAGELFVRRARAARATFALTPRDAPAVAALCRRLDGLPLALELAAARVRTLSPEQLLDRLGDRLALLTRGPRDAPARQQTLRAALDWSYDLLDSAEQRLFARLGVFAGSFDLGAAEAVAGADLGLSGSVLDGVDGLVAHGLLESVPASPPTPEGASDAPSAAVRPAPASWGRAGEGADREEGRVAEVPSDEGPRFRMLESVRAYARARLAESGTADVAHRRHAAHFRSRAEEDQPEPRRRGPRREAWMARLAREQDDLLAALAWSLAGAAGIAPRTPETAGGPHAVRHDETVGAGSGSGSGAVAEATETALRLAAVLGRFWFLCGRLGGGRPWLDRALALPAGTPSHASPATDRMLAARARVLLVAGRPAAEDGPRGRARLQESAALFEALGDARGRADALQALGLATEHAGDRAAARSLLEESLALRRSLGDPRDLAAALEDAGVAATNRGDLERADALHGESLALYRALGDAFGTAAALQRLAEVALERRDPTPAVSLLEESLALRRSLDDPRGVAETLHHLAEAARLQGDAERSVTLYEESLALSRDLPGAQGYAAHARLGLGRLALERGDRRRAAALLAAGAGAFYRSGDRRLLAVGLAGLAGAALQGGDPQRAARLQGAAAALLDALGVRLPRADRLAFERDRTGSRRLLGEPAHAAAEGAGRALPLERALAEGLEVGAADAADVTATLNTPAPPAARAEPVAPRARET